MIRARHNAKFMMAATLVIIAPTICYSSEDILKNVLLFGSIPYRMADEAGNEARTEKHIYEYKLLDLNAQEVDANLPESVDVYALVDAKLLLAKGIKNVCVSLVLNADVADITTNNSLHMPSVDEKSVKAVPGIFNWQQCQSDPYTDEYKRSLLIKFSDIGLKNISSSLLKKNQWPTDYKIEVKVVGDGKVLGEKTREIQNPLAD